MPLAPLTRFGPYEIVGPAGAGGMGEVYRARDTRLGRDVAVKVLPAALAADPEWRRRLEREARAISALSHPNICHLYDLGHHDGVDYLVMEFLEGETLAQRLAGGPLPLEQALRLGIEIADGLHGAHRKGIVHRDLKPGNVMLTRNGARLMDFGVAKPTPGVAAAGEADHLPTEAFTAVGTLIGTFPYMSPEQARGAEVDSRSDIFALGALLYEMITGRRAFDGESPAAVLASILERDPPSATSLQPTLPAALEDVLRGCLTKDPEERWQTAHDVKLQLQGIGRRLGATETKAEPPPRRRPSTGLLAGLLLALGMVIALAALGGRLSAPAATPPLPLRASILPPAGHSFSPNDFAVSPDGRRIAFVATSADGTSTLWVQSLSSPQASQMPGSERAVFPFWSPDSRWVAFYAGDKLMRVEPGGSGVQVITDVSLNARGGAWGREEVIVFAPSVFGPLFKVPANGGVAVPATQLPEDAPGEAHRFPQFLPDGRRFLYVASWTDQRRSGLYLASLDGEESRLVSSEIGDRVLLTAGQLLFVQGGVVYAQPFDSRRGALTGSPRPVVHHELTADWRFGDVPFSVSDHGLLVFQSRLTYNSQLVWFDRSGRELGSVGAPGSMSPAISPDGRRVAATFDSHGSGRLSLWVHDLQREVSSRLTSEGTDTALSWSGDGHWLAYSSSRALTGLYRRLADGSGGEQRLLESGAHMLVNDYSRDGRSLLFMDFGRGTPALRSIDVESGGIEDVTVGAEGAFSPDGRWIAYLGFPVGTLYLQRAGAEDPGRVQLFDGPGSQPRWRGDGREIYFISSDKRMMAVSLTERDGTLEPGPAEPLFQTRIIQSRLVLFQYDVTPDGQRFLINSLPREDSAAPLTVLTGWSQEPRR
jgi:eukaryotic-like serine/threonine-protein kinase